MTVHKKQQKLTKQRLKINFFPSVAEMTSQLESTTSLKSIHYKQTPQERV